MLARLPEVFKIWRLNTTFPEESDRSSDYDSTSSVEDADLVQEVVETDYRVFEDTPGEVVIEKKQMRNIFLHDGSDSHASDSSFRALDAKAIAKHRRSASRDGLKLSRGNVVRNSEQYDIRSSSKNPRQYAHRGDTIYGPARRPLMHTYHESGRHLDADRENRFTSRPTLVRKEREYRDGTRDNTYEKDNLAREAGADQDHYRRGSFERVRPFQGHVPMADPHRMRPTFYGDESRTRDVRKAVNNHSTSNLRPDASLLPWIHDDHTTTRHGEELQLTVRPKQLRFGRVWKAAEPKDDTLFHPEIASRRREHRGSLHESDNSEPSERGTGRLVRFESRSNVRGSGRRLTGYKNPERSLSRHKNPGHAAQRLRLEATNSSKGRNAPEVKEDEEDVITRTLKRYTIFNSDNDPDLVTSPEEADSSGLSDHGTFDVTTLEQAKKTLRRLVEKQEKASKDGDLMTESDLKYHAIPDVEAQIQQLTSQKEQGLEDSEDEVEHDGRHGPIPTEDPAYDSDHQTEVSNVQDAPSGSANPRHGDEPIGLEVDYDREQKRPTICPKD